jgi:hypothetical protein
LEIAQDMGKTAETHTVTGNDGCFTSKNSSFGETKFVIEKIHASDCPAA